MMMSTLSFFFLKLAGINYIYEMTNHAKHKVPCQVTSQPQISFVYVSLIFTVYANWDI